LNLQCDIRFQILLSNDLYRYTVDALKSIRRFYPRAPVMVVSAPGEDYTVLCRAYVCAAEVWKEGGEGEGEGGEGGLRGGGLGGGGGVGGGAGGGFAGGSRVGAGTAVVGSTMRLTGDAGSWGEEAAAARFPGPPDICGSGRAKEFVASVRAVARWAAAVVGLCTS
jgi:hypothetical protein